MVNGRDGRVVHEVDGDVRTFDYVAKLDERNEDYLVRYHPLLAAAPSVDALWAKMRSWDAGAVLDQGQEGSCVGHGVVGEYLASPVRGGYDSVHGHEEAVKVYNRAKVLDEFAGEAYDGTSVNAGMKVGRERGWWDDYHWAKNMNEFRQGLELGPVVIGVTWRRGMYSTNTKGRVSISGPEVGGHCLLVTGWIPSGLGDGVFRWRNSWGPSYGLRGNGWIGKDDLRTILFDAGNEAAVATGRHIGAR